MVSKAGPRLGCKVLCPSLYDTNTTSCGKHSGQSVSLIFIMLHVHHITVDCNEQIEEKNHNNMTSCEAGERPRALEVGDHIWDVHQPIKLIL